MIHILGICNQAWETVERLPRSDTQQTIVRANACLIGVVLSIGTMLHHADMLNLLILGHSRVNVLYKRWILKEDP